MSLPATPDPTTVTTEAATTVRKPFEQVRFEDLPERPRVQHRYYDADTEDVVVDSRPFGRVRTSRSGSPASRVSCDASCATTRRAGRTRRPLLPLSLIYARQDPTVPPKIGPKLHALVPGSELHWLERSSHFAQVDAPERLASLLEGFFER